MQALLHVDGFGRRDLAHITFAIANCAVGTAAGIRTSTYSLCKDRCTSSHVYVGTNIYEHAVSEFVQPFDGSRDR